MAFKKQPQHFVNFSTTCTIRYHCSAGELLLNFIISTHQKTDQITLKYLFGCISRTFYFQHHIPHPTDHSSVVIVFYSKLSDNTICISNEWDYERSCARRFYCQESSSAAVDERCGNNSKDPRHIFELQTYCCTTFSLLVLSVFC